MLLDKKACIYFTHDQNLRVVILRNYIESLYLFCPRLEIWCSYFTYIVEYCVSPSIHSVRVVPKKAKVELLYSDWTYDTPLV